MRKGAADPQVGLVFWVVVFVLCCVAGLVFGTDW